MAAELLTDASRALDANANPFSGAKWYFFLSGTMTPQAVYADADLAVSLGATVTSDVGGKFVPIYFDASKKYRGILENSTGTTTIYDIDPINPGILFDLGQESGAGLIGWIRAAAGAVMRTVTAKFFGYVDVEDFGAVGDGVEDDTLAWTRAISYVKTRGLKLRAMSTSYLVSTLTFDGSGYEVATTAGNLFKQKSGLTGDGLVHAIWKITGSNIRFGDASFEGNIATDTGESSHAVQMESCKGVRLGSLYGTNIRGDVLYVYGRDSSFAEMSLGNYVERVSGTNIYRCLVALVGGECNIGSIINDGPVGYREFDAEPNTGGNYQPVVSRIGFIYGGCSQITSADVAIQNSRIEIGTYEANWGLVQATTPAYPSAPGANAWGLSIAYCKSVRIGLLKMRDYTSYPISLGDGWDAIRIDVLDFFNCNQTENTFKSIVVQQGTAGAGVLDIGYVKGTTEAADRMVFRANAGPLKVNVGGGNLTATSLAVECAVSANGLAMNCSSASGFVLLLSPGSSLKGCTFTNAGSATLARESNNLVLDNVTGTFGTLFTVNTDNVTILNSNLNSQRYTYRTYNTNTPAAVASAATVTLPLDRDVIQISGTTNITSVTAGAANANRRVTLVFSGVLTFTDGSNLKLAGNFVTAADASITIACVDGTNWVECSRSTN